MFHILADLQRHLLPGFRLDVADSHPIEHSSFLRQCTPILRTPQNDLIDRILENVARIFKILRGEASVKDLWGGVLSTSELAAVAWL